MVSALEIIDAYLHCGLRKFRPIEEIEGVMQFAGVSRAVIVQHLGEFDNSYIEGIVRQSSDRFAGVCLVDHTSPDAQKDLARYAASGLFKGVRLTVDTLNTAPAIWHAAANLGMVLVLYAPEGLGNCIDSLRAFLDSHKCCKIVLTHLGNPNVRESPEYGAYRSIFELAGYPGVYYQVSGMKMLCRYPHEPLYPLIAEAARRFGASRLIWGSNYPVVGDQQGYVSDLRLLLDGKLPVPGKAIPAISGGNARILWFE